jgi:hypothetical protein
LVLGLALPNLPVLVATPLKSSLALDAPGAVELDAELRKVIFAVFAKGIQVLGTTGFHNFPVALPPLRFPSRAFIKGVDLIAHFLCLPYGKGPPRRVA